MRRIIQNHREDARFKFTNVFSTLVAFMGTGGGNGDMILEDDNRIRRITPLECCRLQGFPDDWCDNLGRDDISEDELTEWREIFRYYSENVVHWKRLKTDKQILAFLKNPYSDRSAYKMWGNGVALPCVRFVMEGIAEFENE